MNPHTSHELTTARRVPLDVGQLHRMIRRVSEFGHRVKWQLVRENGRPQEGVLPR